MKKYKAHIALVVANVFFGINFPVAKSLMPKYFQPIEVIILRAGISAILFFIVQRLFVKEKIEKKDILTLALCGLFGVSINQLLFFEGLNLSSTIDASIIRRLVTNIHDSRYGLTFDIADYTPPPEPVSLSIVNSPFFIFKSSIVFI